MRPQILLWRCFCRQPSHRQVILRDAKNGHERALDALFQTEDRTGSHLKEIAGNRRCLGPWWERAVLRKSLRPTFEILLLVMIASVAILVHGYHLGSDDAEIYVPAIKKVADPALFPFDSVFFMDHASLSFFPDLIGNSARLTRLPIDWAIFLWHALSVFLLLLAARQLLRACFQNKRAQWAGVALLASVLTVPVAGTALVIMDPYLTARSLSTPATLFAIACFATGSLKRGLLWLLFTALIHPQMSAYGAAFLGCLWLARYFARPLTRQVLSPERASLAAIPFAAIPLSFDFEPAHGVYRDVLSSRSYFSVSNWTWYEWVGVLAPLVLLWWFSSIAAANTLEPFRRISRSLVLFGLVFTAAGLVLSTSEHFDNFLRLQPMRSFHLIYVVFFLFLGGLIGDQILRDRTWRWCCLFLPLAATMWTLQARAYPSCAHIEWPGASYRSGWLSAFIWVRGHTPKDAIFALDPNYMAIVGDDQHGFRAVAERSALADNLKDSGAVSLFPQLANLWKKQVLAQQGWKNFKMADFRNLAVCYGVGWFVLQRSQVITGLICPYQNDAVKVCRFDLTPTAIPIGANHARSN